MPNIQSFQCSRCGEHVVPARDEYATVCPQCAGSLYVRYAREDMRRARRDEVKDGAQSMWRYGVVLPSVEPVTLGEGWTPMLRSRMHQNLWWKEEGANPTGSFKARGLGMAVTMAKHFGVRKIAIPSAGNAAGALAAYCAAAGIEAHIFMPKDVPKANYVECVAYGAQVTLVDGLIGDCGKVVAGRKQEEGWFDISSLKEPFRVEGKKTMGYELAEQFGWELPDVVFYPTGGGVGLVGMWKAFEEMEEMGWIRKGTPRPRMVVVQAAGCAPIPKAFEEGKLTSEMWPNATTAASGLRVPKSYGDYIVLDIVRKSGGTAIAITEEEMFESLGEWAQHEGVVLSPEGAMATAAYDKLMAGGWLKPSERVLIFNTGSGMKYTDVIAQGLRIRRAPQRAESAKVGGIIGPF
ncbi:MAG: threonine synthase [Acidobacteriaceae bacterium]